MPSSGDKAIKAFLDDIKDAKFKDFSAKEYTIAKDRQAGFRLDHQGVSENYPTP